MRAWLFPPVTPRKLAKLKTIVELSLDLTDFIEARKLSLSEPQHRYITHWIFAATDVLPTKAQIYLSLDHPPERGIILAESSLNPHYSRAAARLSSSWQG